MGNSEWSSEEPNANKLKNNGCSWTKSESKSRKTKPKNLLGNDQKINEATYITDDTSQKNVTRMDHDREMIVGFWSRGKFGHASVFICYFSEKTGCGLIGRVFSVELFTNSGLKKNVLSIKGPLYRATTRGYNCKQFYVIHSNMDKLIDIAKTTMAAHGKYSKLMNNCRHFCDKYLDKIKTECCGLSIDVKADVINKYIDQYVPQNIYAKVLDEQDEMNALFWGTRPPPPVNVDVRVNEAEFAKTLSLLQVLKKYPLHS